MKESSLFHIRLIDWELVNVLETIGVDFHNDIISGIAPPLKPLLTKEVISRRSSLTNYSTFLYGVACYLVRDSTCPFC